MSHLLYLLSLCVGIGGLLVIDHRFKLAFFHDAWRTIRTIGPAMIVFIVWDAAGIILHIFSHGASAFSLPFVIAPQFPIEELFFLFLLCYVTLLTYLGVSKLWPHT